MKRTKKKTRGLSIWLILLFIVLVIGGIVTSHSSEPVLKKSDPFENVLKYQSMIEKSLSKYDLEEYTTVLLALMQQESKGKGGDPMQASESAGRSPGSIQDPKKSIHQGVKHFRNVLKYGKRKDVDFPTIIQAYNMGQGYIQYVSKHGGEHSEKLAKKFSLKQVHKKPEVYDCGGFKMNFRQPYCYGDFTYSTKVNQYLHSLKQTVRVSNEEKTANQ